jgi:hypothetical protein
MLAGLGRCLFGLWMRKRRTRKWWLWRAEVQYLYAMDVDDPETGRWIRDWRKREEDGSWAEEGGRSRWKRSGQWRHADRGSVGGSREMERPEASVCWCWKKSSRRGGLPEGGSGRRKSTTLTDRKTLPCPSYSNIHPL